VNEGELSTSSYHELALDSLIEDRAAHAAKVRELLEQAGHPLADWKPMYATSEQILDALAEHELQARAAEAAGNAETAALHWTEWRGLHILYVRALANEVRADLGLVAKVYSS
jgi:hypothetical protein